MNASAARQPVSWKFWAISVLSLLWNSIGAYDYVMTRLRDLAYLNKMTDGKGQPFLDWMDHAGIVVQIGWPVGIWASVAGSLLLLARSRHAVTAFLISLIGAVISMGYERVTGFPAELDSGAVQVMQVVVIGIIALLWWWSRRAAARGQIS